MSFKEKSTIIVADDEASLIELLLLLNFLQKCGHESVLSNFCACFQLW